MTEKFGTWMPNSSAMDEPRLTGIPSTMARLPDRSELKEKSREATLVLVIIVCIFLICNFWGFVLTLLERILDHETLPSTTPNLEYSSLDQLEQTRFLQEANGKNGKLSKKDTSPIRILQNGSGKSVLVDPVNGTTGRRTTLTWFPATDNEMNGQVLFLTDEEGTLC
ncbi:hypothetical protein TELCIR_17118 [Teladorsagia circumcincta]|uniref:Uncharacterized protein n=1 Tax=Teladorsagia circumcincta TaxID=45464 RepID=A0A2G9TVU1_TELCI|nr:hypothetical protein TELCIR_17118 [Teladorsagia circumcincta]